MATIIAGRFHTQDAANEAVSALERAGFSARDLQSFYISPPGMHGNVPVVDNDQPQVGTEHAGAKALTGAAVGALAGVAAADERPDSAEDRLSASRGRAGEGSSG